VVITVRHKRGDSLAELKAAVADSSRAARQGRQWKTLQKRIGSIGVLAAPEVTYSLRNGWHYHAHLALPLLIDDEDVAHAGCVEFVERYLTELRRRGFDANWNGQRVSVSRDPLSAASYVAKGLAWELAGGAATKSTTRSTHSITPFEIAKLAMHGDDRMKKLWREYAEVMPGTRSCVVTASIAKALQIENSEGEETDDCVEEVDEEKTDVVGTIPTMNWNNLLREGHVPEFFEKLETSSATAWPSVREWAMTMSASTTLRACDIPVDPRDVPIPGENYGDPPLSKPELARTIAWRSRDHVNARRYIEDQVEQLQRDNKRFHTPAPSLAEVAVFLAGNNVSDTPISRALEKSALCEILATTEKKRQLDSQPCSAGPQNADIAR
jgi:hypothetical protein